MNPDELVMIKHFSFTVQLYGYESLIKKASEISIGTVLVTCKVD